MAAHIAHTAMILSLCPDLSSTVFSLLPNLNMSVAFTPPSHTCHAIPFHPRKMCNILSYTFTCAHQTTHPRSTCSGTKRKRTRSSTKAACSSEPSLTLHLRLACGPCQYAAWETKWRLRLERAHAFLLDTRGGGDDGDGEQCVKRLVARMEDAFMCEGWTVGREIGWETKRVGRVQGAEYARVRSRLGVEVRREDVCVEDEGDCGASWDRVLWKAGGEEEEVVVVEGERKRDGQGDIEEDFLRENVDWTDGLVDGEGEERVEQVVRAFWDVVNAPFEGKEMSCFGGNRTEEDSTTRLHQEGDENRSHFIPIR
ncbi:hypothetical protein GQ44DRAFT_384667 [Phaeosphaeriaceae sp. PMI808]|nr:hypothetical protein GQ44DRAFT_384667 [Phaeosphaeriaceae sp. PMI808]